MDSQPGQRLPIAEAASALGVSEKTIRRRIKAGTIAAERVATPQGHVWLVEVGSDHQDAPGQAVLVTVEDRQAAVLALTRTVADDLTRSLFTPIEELAVENAALKERIWALEASKEAPVATESTAAGGAVSRPTTGVWSRLVGWFGG